MKVWDFKFYWNGNDFKGVSVEFDITKYLRYRFTKVYTRRAETVPYFMDPLDIL